MLTSQHRLHYLSHCNPMDNYYPFLSVLVLLIALLLKIDFAVMNYHTAFHRLLFVLPQTIFPCHSLSIVTLPSSFLRFYISSILSPFFFSISSVSSFSTSRHLPLPLFSYFHFFNPSITVLSISAYSFELFPPNISCLQLRERS